MSNNLRNLTHQTTSNHMMSTVNSQSLSTALILISANIEGLTASKESMLSEMCKREHWHCLCLQETHRAPHLVPTISAYTRWNCLATTDASKSRSTPILTVRCAFQRVFCLGSVQCGWTDPLYDYKAATTTTGPNPSKAPTDIGRCTSEPRPCYKVSLSSMHSQHHKSWS